MKKIVVAIDSFKGSLSTFQAGSAIAEAVKEVYEDAQTVISPIADGGEGTVEAIISAGGGELIETTVCNPLGEKIRATYGYIKETKTAIIEMSAAAGITLITENHRNPLNTTTYGVGEMIADAISKGCRRFVIGIGGSATNDGGVGMLQALGFEFLDAKGEQVEFGAKGLENIVTIKTDNAIGELDECSFCVACDVKNVLCGENGCSAVYGPQKGATPEMIKAMDLWLENYARLTKSVIPASDADREGTGAAGGMGFALLSYLDATLMSGIELVMRETNLEKHIQDADLVITGEGRLDGQSTMGKAPVGVAKLAKKYNKPVIAFSGCVTEEAVVCNEQGIDAFFPIVRKPCTLDEAMNVSNAHKNLKDTAVQVLRLIKTLNP
ncbi:MAG: glycerate kinase [Clostridia bacterium]|nr:glycerate kinase [Clostridia bacterium]